MTGTIIPQNFFTFGFGVGGDGRRASANARARRFRKISLPLVLAWVEMGGELPQMLGHADSAKFIYLWFWHVWR